MSDSFGSQSQLTQHPSFLLYKMAACAVSTIIYGAELPIWTFITNNYLQTLNANIILSFVISMYIYVDSSNVKKGNP